MTMQTILVTGATGNVGHHVATQLTEAGITVRALSRDPSSPRLPAGVTAVRGDLTDPDSVRNAAAGADAAFLVWPFLTAQGAEAVGAPRAWSAGPTARRPGHSSTSATSPMSRRGSWPTASTQARATS
jgi:uncharacterized protein YbjT (DUF2867 family)